jgi:hypothetical protein
MRLGDGRMPRVLNRPKRAERLTDPDWYPANTTTTLPALATLSARTPGHREIRVPFGGGEFVVGIDAEPPRWLLPTLQTLGDLLELRVDWDTYGSPSIQPAYVESALRVIFAVMRDNTPVPSVVPTSRGGIQIEWHTRDVDLEIEFETPSLIRGFFEDRRSGQTWERDLSFDQNALVQAIVVLSQRT